MRLCQATLKNTRKTVKFLRKASKLELHSLDNNYPTGVNPYLYKDRENVAAYAGFAGEPLTGTREAMHKEMTDTLKSTNTLYPANISEIRQDYSPRSRKWDMNPWFFQNREWMLYGKKGDRLAYSQTPVLFIKFRWNETEFRLWEPNWRKYYENSGLDHPHVPKQFKAKHAFYDDMHLYMNPSLKTNMEEQGFVWSKKRDEENIETSCETLATQIRKLNPNNHPYIRLVYSFWGKQNNLPKMYVKHLSLSGLQIVSITDTTPLKEHVKPWHQVTRMSPSLENKNAWQRLSRLNKELKRAGTSDIESKEDYIRATRAKISQKLDKPRVYKIHPDAPVKFYETYHEFQDVFESKKGHTENVIGLYKPQE